MTDPSPIWNTVETYLAGAFAATSVGAAPADGGREAVSYFLLCAIQLALVACVMRPLERVCPTEDWTGRDLTYIDRRYTLLKLLVVVPLFTFVLLPGLSAAFGATPESEAPLQLERFFPALRDHPLLLFLLYFVIYDFVYYLIHRLQHALPWWWALHSLHHSQRQLNCWSNDRDHYLDDLLEVGILAALGAVIGVAPVEYAALVLCGRLVESYSHANVRFGFGRYLDKLLVDPKFHRLHHMRADPSRPGLHNCNFALVFPIWDIAFRTALYNEPPRPCGVDDPAVDGDNELGLLGQQAAGLRRLRHALRPTRVEEAHSAE